MVFNIAGRAVNLKWADFQILLLLLLLLLPVQEAYLTNHSTKRHETWQTDRVLWPHEPRHIKKYVNNILHEKQQQTISANVLLMAMHMVGCPTTQQLQYWQTWNFVENEPLYPHKQYHVKQYVNNVDNNNKHSGNVCDI